MARAANFKLVRNPANRLAFKSLAGGVERLGPVAPAGAAAFHIFHEGNAAMALFSKDIKSLNDLFVHQLKDIYYAEKQLVKALPKLIDKATSSDLKQGL